MQKCFKAALMMCLVCVLVAGCGQKDSNSGGSAKAATNIESNAKYLLAEEPSNARTVIDVRQNAKDGDSVVVVGRIGGSQKPFVSGRAAFTIVDMALVPCNQKEGDTCATPWDYCCDTKEDLARASLLVKFLDDQGKTVPQDAQSLLGIEPLQTVVVRGRVKRDSDGNLVVLADALHARPESTKKGKS